MEFFILYMKEKRYHIVIASIVFAVLMWVSINLGNEYTIVQHIPVALENLSPEKALKSPIPKQVTVRFKGQGWDLAAMLFAGEAKYCIDVSALNSERRIITAHNLSEHIKPPLTVQPIDIKPETLFLALGERKEKQVPVIPRLSIHFREGFGIAGHMRVVPESVTVFGTENFLESISGWNTVYRRYDNLSTPIDVQVPLEETNILSLDVQPPSVHIQVDVQQFAEKTISGIPLTVQAAPNNREVVFIPPKMDIILRGGIEQLAKVTPSEIQVTVEYETLVKDSSGVISPTVVVPEGTKVIRKTPERFQFFIRKKLYEGTLSS